MTGGVTGESGLRAEYAVSLVAIALWVTGGVGDDISEKNMRIQ